ncbi:MAG: hypothetical protein AAF329_16625 [Cyanobacteria bacterium P01_A01_bin.17]
MATAQSFVQSIKMAAAQKIFPQFKITQAIGRYEATLPTGEVLENTSLTELCAEIVSMLFDSVYG